MRRGVTLLVRALLGLFFRRLEAAGIEQLPRSGPAIVVLNHPNGLLDPAILVALAPRPVSFLAKAPLFRTPLVSTFVKALDSIPVFRAQDGGASPERTRETLSLARDVLERGGVIALFPEGTTHDDPSLKPLRSGAARLALGAAVRLARRPARLRIVPAGLFFARKTAFRSDALLVFGESFDVPAAGETGGEPDPKAVRELTSRISAALALVTLHADAREALDLAAAAESIVDGVDPSLKETFEVRHLLLERYARLVETRRDEVEDIAARLRRHLGALAAARLDASSLAPLEASPSGAILSALLTIAFSLLLLPAALVGLVTHWPPYRLVGLLASRWARDDESVLATGKLIGGMVFFPFSWGLLAAGTYLRAGASAALLALALLPLCGLAALLTLERLDSSVTSLRALWILLFSRRAALRLLAERRLLREKISALAREP